MGWLHMRLHMPECQGQGNFRSYGYMHALRCLKTGHAEYEGGTPGVIALYRTADLFL